MGAEEHMGLAGVVKLCEFSTFPVLCPCPTGCARHVGSSGEKTTCCLNCGAWGWARKTLLVAVLKARAAELLSSTADVCMTDSRCWLFIIPQVTELFIQDVTLPYLCEKLRLALLICSLCTFFLSVGMTRAELTEGRYTAPLEPSSATVVSRTLSSCVGNAVSTV